MNACRSVENKTDEDYNESVSITGKYEKDVKMGDSAPKPKFVVDESGKKSAVLLKIRDYEQLVAAWEEVADAKDFAAARDSAKEFVSPSELRGKVLT